MTQVQLNETADEVLRRIRGGAQIMAKSSDSEARIGLVLSDGTRGTVPSSRISEIEKAHEITVASRISKRTEAEWRRDREKMRAQAIGAAIKEFRRPMSLGREVFAELLEVERDVVGAIEEGRVGSPLFNAEAQLKAVNLAQKLLLKFVTEGRALPNVRSAEVARALLDGSYARRFASGE